jgi:hypothetical protein
MELGEKIEGTMVLEGLIQGRVPPIGDVADKLREWVTFVGNLGPRFNLEIRGNQFSLLPDDKPFSAVGLGAGAEHGMTQALEQLAGLFGPGPEKAQLFSTLRSSEYRKGLEVQTVYSIADGKVRIQSRSVEADTTAPPEPIDAKQKLKMGLVGFGMAVVLLGAAMLIPDIRELVWQVFDTSTFNVSDLKAEPGPYAPWLSVKIVDEKTHRRGVTLEIARTKDYPMTEEALDAAGAAVEKSVRGRAALENIARRKIRVEFFDRDGKFVGDRETPIFDLNKDEKMSVYLAFPNNAVIGRIVLAP